MFRFTIRELVLVAGIVAMSAVWWADCELLQTRQRRIEERLAVQLQYHQRDEVSRQIFEESRRRVERLRGGGAAQGSASAMVRP